MGKGPNRFKRPRRSNRGNSDRPRTRNWKAPAVLPPGTQPQYESEFVPIDIPQEILNTIGALCLLDCIEDCTLLEWELGRKGTHIASRWVADGGNEDILTAMDPDDDDYEGLAIAHANRLATFLGSTVLIPHDADSDYEEEYLNVCDMLVDAQLMRLEHPDTFYAPSIPELRSITIGDAVKICFEGNKPGQPGGERFWCMVDSVSGGPSGRVCARVDNELLFVPWPVGKKIEFRLEHIYNIAKRPEGALAR